MKRLSQWLAVAGVASSLLLGVSTSMAQDDQNRGGRNRGGGGGGFGGDPAEFRQRMMDGIREQFAVKDDAEWKAIEPLVQGVMDARREVGTGGNFGRMFRPRGGGDNAGGGGGGERRRGGPFGGEPDPAQEALDKAVDSKASKEELKTAMAKVRASKKEKEAKLAKAQDDLKKVLSVEQEAVALSMGLVQ